MLAGFGPLVFTGICCGLGGGGVSVCVFIVAYVAIREDATAIFSGYVGYICVHTFN